MLPFIIIVKCHFEESTGHFIKSMISFDKLLYRHDHVLLVGVVLILDGQGVVS